MQKLFAISNTRTLQRLGLSPQTFPNFQKALLKNSIKPTDQSLLFRIPREDFRKLINAHCPINRYSAAKEALKVRTLKKQQRRQSYQDIMLNSNRFLKNCRWAKRPLENVQYDNTLRDLLTFLYGLQTLEKGQKYYSMYLRVYKMNDYLMPIIDDLSRGGKQFQLFSNIRITAMNSYSQPKKIQQSVQNSQNEEEEQLAKRAEEFQKLSGLGRDFSFDEQSEFDQAISKKQKVQQAQIKVKSKEPTIKAVLQERQTTIAEQKVQSTEQIDNREIISAYNQRRRRTVRSKYIQTDNLKLNVFRKSTEIPDQRNHPKFEQLRRKIQLQYNEQQKNHSDTYSNKKQSTKSDRSPSQNPQKPIRNQKQQYPPSRK